MPKKQSKETQADQSKRFKKAVRDMVAAGELDPAEADKAFEHLIKKAVNENSGR